jgi:hypothetical protein
MKNVPDMSRTADSSFERFFRAVSYGAVFCGFSALWISGTVGLLATSLFVSVTVLAWFLEDSRWQIGEKLGTALIVLSLPVFYVVWHFSADAVGDAKGIWIAGLLARMILCLTAVKLLQRKSDRDWIFLYLMGFFEVLLAAGLSISALYLLNFLIYLVLMACSIIAFEIRKTSRRVDRDLSALEGADRPQPRKRGAIAARRVPVPALVVILFTVVLALPLFFLLPRVGGAGLGSSQRGSAMSGFSDKVTLGNFGRIVEDDRVVMRIKIDEGREARSTSLYFRGVALDTFDNKTWTRSKSDLISERRRGLDGRIEIREANLEKKGLVSQTIYLEPMGTSVLFALPRPVEVRGSFDSITVSDKDFLQHTRPYELVSYKVLSDIRTPSPEELRADRQPYPAALAPYRSLPAVFDRRIVELAEQLTGPVNNRYDKVRRIESYLQTEFGYTLQQKATGPEPLAAFLFDVREGHCEYFASAMALMLRTQGIATRIVNGFHGGDYNETVGMTVIRQRHAHAWVEVYFPGSDSWVTFDPTPAGSQPGDAGAQAGMLGVFTQYAEALEAMWMEYFVAFDDDGQRGLRAAAAGEFARFQSTLTTAVDKAYRLTTNWLSESSGSGAPAGSVAYVVAGSAAIAALLYGLYWLMRRFVGRGLLGWFQTRYTSESGGRAVEFYEQMLIVLGDHGLRRRKSQTPLEFALATNLPEALAITEKYQAVRFGDRDLSPTENREMSELIERLKSRR